MHRLTTPDVLVHEVEARAYDLFIPSFASIIPKISGTAENGDWWLGFSLPEEAQNIAGLYVEEMRDRAWRLSSRFTLGSGVEGLLFEKPDKYCLVRIETGPVERKGCMSTSSRPAAQKVLVSGSGKMQKGC